MSWMHTLEKLVEDLTEPNVDEEFRLILTTSPTDNFPGMILQNSVKVSIESSGDVKTTMLNAYNNVSDQWFRGSRQPDVMRTMFFSLTLFHALIIDRKKFGPIGWSNV